MQNDWLVKRLTREQLESEPGGAAFFKMLFDQYQDGDEYWAFCSPAESWEHLAGRSGVALVRDGEIVESVITVMN